MEACAGVKSPAPTGEAAGATVFVALAASVALAAAVDVARGVRVARGVAVGGTRVSVAGTGELVRVAEGWTVAEGGTALFTAVLSGVLTAAGAPQAASR